MSPDEQDERGRVLVAGSDSTSTGILIGLLKSAGCTVRAMASGHAALVAAAETDLLIVDGELPDMEAGVLCRALRAMPASGRLPVVMLSSRCDRIDRRRGMEAFADDFLVKPVDWTELLARVRALLRNRRIEAELRERKRQLEVLRGLTDLLVNTAAVGELAQRIVDAIPEAFGRTSGFLGGVVLSVDQERRVMHAHAMTSTTFARRTLALISPSLRDIHSPFDPPRNLLEEVAYTGEARSGNRLTSFIVPTVPTAMAQTIEHMIGMRGALAQPAKVHGRTIGIFLFVLTKPLGAITPSERTLAIDFANTAGVALENVRLYSAVEQLTLTDPLTGVGNRRQFDRSLADEVERSRRLGYPIGLLLIDLDRLKARNDAEGHQAGDVALRAVARAIRSSARSTDLVSRYGGDEFAVLLPGATIEGAREAGERVRRAVVEVSGVRMTVSVGVSAGKGIDGQALVAAADAALYSAKAAGRNLTVAMPAPLRSSLPSI